MSRNDLAPFLRAVYLVLKFATVNRWQSVPLGIENESSINGNFASSFLLYRPAFLTED